MAKFVYKMKPGDPVDPFGEVLFADVVTRSRTKIVLEDSGGDELVYSGHGFRFNGEEATAGVVTKVEVFSDGRLLMSITDCSFKLTSIDLINVHNNDDLFTKGHDTFTGSQIDDYFPLYGPNWGDDIIKGMGGNDRILASPGSNTIDGGKGSRDIMDYSIYDESSQLPQGIEVDMVAGRIVNPFDKIDKIKNIEIVYGSYLADTFKGSNRDDTFGGYRGNDRLTGAKGADVFEFYDMSAFGASNGKDTITDFGNGADQVLIGYYPGLESFSDLKPLMKQKGSDLHIDFGGGEEIILLGTKKADLKAADFEFVA